MPVFLRKLYPFTKDLLLASRLFLLLRPLAGALRFASNFSLLTAWVQKHRKGLEFNDFYKPVRVYPNRTKLHAFVADKEALASRKIHYFEFGVAGATSFKWWLAQASNPQSLFYGFDTFEGLPESWGYFSKGSMSFSLPDIPDGRAQFFKGLFQDTLAPFLKDYKEDMDAVRVIHLDADLYSSTLFVLTMLAPCLRPGDLLIFDEFNVANHEFAAWDAFVKSYYFEYEVVGAVNNFYQTCFRLTKTLAR